MTSDYKAPGDRIASYGSSMLPGSDLSQDGLMTQLQSNLRFRLNSARDMLVGSSESDAGSPIERRKQIRDRRRAMMGSVGGGLLGSGDSSGMGSGTSSSGEGTSSRGSGNIGTSTSGNSGASSPMSAHSTPSMSDVDRGTKERAEDRGFRGQ